MGLKTWTKASLSTEQKDRAEPRNFREESHAGSLLVKTNDSICNRTILALETPLDMKKKTLRHLNLALIFLMWTQTAVEGPAKEPRDSQEILSMPR